MTLSKRRKNARHEPRGLETLCLTPSFVFGEITVAWWCQHGRQAWQAQWRWSLCTRWGCCRCRLGVGLEPMVGVKPARMVPAMADDKASRQ